jgi:hypothetical protein
MLYEFCPLILHYNPAKELLTESPLTDKEIEV